MIDAGEIGQQFADGVSEDLLQAVELVPRGAAVLAQGGGVAGLRIRWRRALQPGSGITSFDFQQACGIAAGNQIAVGA